jgi:hypothetical protein
MATPRKTNSRSRTTSSKKADTGIAARTGRTIRDRPYTSAAIATGAVTAVAAAAAGLFFFRRSDRSFAELTEGLTTRVKDGLSDAGEKIRGVAGLEPKADATEKSQSEIAEEALTLKETGKKSATPADPAIG